MEDEYIEFEIEILTEKKTDFPSEQDIYQCVVISSWQAWSANDSRHNLLDIVSLHFYLENENAGFTYVCTDKTKRYVPHRGGSKRRSVLSPIYKCRMIPDDPSMITLYYLTR